MDPKTYLMKIAAAVRPEGLLIIWQMLENFPTEVKQFSVHMAEKISGLEHTVAFGGTQTINFRFVPVYSGLKNYFLITNEELAQKSLLSTVDIKYLIVFKIIIELIKTEDTEV